MYCNQNIVSEQTEYRSISENPAVFYFKSDIKEVCKMIGVNFQREDERMTLLVAKCKLKFTFQT